MRELAAILGFFFGPAIVVLLICLVLAPLGWIGAGVLILLAVGLCAENDGAG